MYRLLIATRQPKTKALIADLKDWESFGFKPPHLRENAAEAEDCMNKHAIDAIAIDYDSEWKPFLDLLNTTYSDLPLFPIESSQEKQYAVLRDLSHLLARIKADDTNDQRDLSYMMHQQRARWMRRLISGMEHSADDIRRKMLLHRCTMLPDDPCVIACLYINKDDAFINERWHYGQDRLEMALSNFFGYHHAGLAITVTVVSQEEVRVLFCPEQSTGQLDETDIARYVKETIEQIEHYLGLSLHLREIRSLNHITDFAVTMK